MTPAEMATRLLRELSSEPRAFATACVDRGELESVLRYLAKLERVAEALSDAAKSLETVSKWPRDRSLYNDEEWSELRAWAASRARVANEALADLDTPEHGFTQEPEDE